MAPVLSIRNPAPYSQLGPATVPLTYLARCAQGPCGTDWRPSLYFQGPPRYPSITQPGTLRDRRGAPQGLGPILSGTAGVPLNQPSRYSQGPLQNPQGAHVVLKGSPVALSGTAEESGATLYRMNGVRVLGKETRKVCTAYGSAFRISCRRSGQQVTTGPARGSIRRNLCSRNRA